MTAEDPVDALYAVEPKEFIAARDALAKELRAQGDGEAAAAVKALRRPTVAAWALNQLARDDAARVRSLLDAAAQLRSAQADALRSGDPAELRTATRAWRDAVRDATEAAVARTTESQRDDIIATLEAAVADESVADALRAGRLSSAAHGGSGFDVAGMPDVGELAPAASKAKGAKAPDRKRLERALEDAEAALADATARVEDARAAVLDAEHVLHQREQRARDAQAARDDAAAALEAFD